MYLMSLLQFRPQHYAIYDTSLTKQILEKYEVTYKQHSVTYMLRQRVKLMRGSHGLMLP